MVGIRNSCIVWNKSDPKGEMPQGIYVDSILEYLDMHISLELTSENRKLKGPWVKSVKKELCTWEE